MDHAATIEEWLAGQGLRHPALRERLARSTRLVVDSREFKDGHGFIAIKGAHHDGHQYLPSLAARAGFVVVEKTWQAPSGWPESLPTLRVADPLAFSRLFAPVYYGYPSYDLRMLGVTGTNGKTTSTYLFEALARCEGRTPGIIGTIEARWGDQRVVASNTTPDAVALQALLYDMRRSGVDTVAMEVSSHALDQGRVNGIALDGLTFTNITRDHLDYHQTMEAYFEAKLKGFDLLEESPKVAKRAAVWAGTEMREALMRRIAHRPFETRVFGIAPQGFAGLSFKVDQCSMQGSTGTLLWKGDALWSGTLRLVGEFNILNTLGCLALWLNTGASRAELKEQAARGMEAVNAVHVPGRLEPIPAPHGGMVFVDYAHTPDALENILGTLKKLPHGRLLCVFGCGGDRDKTKRPLMGRIAGSMADQSYVTSDNPRTEDPRAILDMIEAGIREVTSAYVVIENREAAIRQAVNDLRAGEILVIAGKGHEDYQILGDKKFHFDDREIARKYLA